LGRGGLQLGGKREGEKCHDLEPRTEGNHRIRAESQKKKEKNEKNKKNREDRAVRTITNSVTCRSHYTGLLLKRVP